MKNTNGMRVRSKKGHVYQFDKYRYPSVTTILHAVGEEPEGIKQWKKNYRSSIFLSADEYTRYTQMRGIFVHYAVLNSITPFYLDMEELPPLSHWSLWGDKMVSDIHSSLRLWEMIDIKISNPISIEEPLCHHGYWYAGQPDLLGMITYKDKTCYTIVDLKTSKQPRENHFIQIGAYSQMVQNPKVERGLLIYLDPLSKKPHIEVLTKNDILENILIFNEMRDEFYSNPNVIDEYGLIIPQ